MTGSNRTILRNSFLIGGGLLLGNVFSLLFRFLIARIYGPDSFGVFTIGFMLVSITMTFALLGLPAGVTKFVSEYRSTGQKNRLTTVIAVSFAFSLTLGILLTGGLVIYGPYVARNILNSPDSATFIKWFALQIPANIIIMLSAAFVLGVERGGLQIAVKEFVPKLLFLIFAIGVIVIEGTIFEVGISYVLSRWVSAIFALYILSHLLRDLGALRMNLREPAPQARAVFQYSAPLLFTGITSFILNWIDTFFISFFLSDSSVGIYQAAFILGSSISLFFTAIAESLFPNFAALLSNDKYAHIAQRYAEGVKWGLVVTTAPFLYLTLFPNVSLGMLFGGKYSAGSTSLIVILLGQYISVCFGPANGLLKSAGETKYIFYTYMIASVVNIVFNVVLIPSVGIVGAAVGTSTAMATQTTLLYLKAQTIVDLHLTFGAVVRTTIAGVTSGIIIYIAIGNRLSLFTFLLSILAFSALYAINCIIFRVVDIEDVVNLRKIIS